MEDVLDVYQRPYDAKRPVVCIDEGGKELRDTPQGTLPMQPGQPAKQDYEYERLGKANVFLWVEPLAGKRRVSVTERHTYPDFAEQLRRLVDEDYPDADRIVLVCDNLNTHGPACLYATYTPNEAHRINQKIEWHYTPEHGSWLNMAECELSVLARQCLARRIPDIATLTKEALAWETHRNAKQVTINWQFTTADARIKLRRLYPVFQEMPGSTAPTHGCPAPLSELMAKKRGVRKPVDAPTALAVASRSGPNGRICEAKGASVSLGGPDIVVDIESRQLCDV
jgi:transposase